MKTYELDLEGMSCQHCVRSVQEALRGLPGISVADVSVGHVHVEAGDDVPLDAIAAAVSAAGYPVLGR